MDEVGVEDDFHELGGHSLLLVQMAGKVRERLGKELPLAYLLPHRTVASLADAVDLGLRQPPEAASPEALGTQLRADAVLALLRGGRLAGVHFHEGLHDPLTGVQPPGLPDHLRPDRPLHRPRGARPGPLWSA